MTQTSFEIIESLKNGTINHYNVIFVNIMILWVYAHLLKEKKWSMALGALALFSADVINEMMNTIIMFCTNYAPLWGTPKANATGWLLLPGWCFEIVGMFAVGAVPFFYIEEVIPWKGRKIIGLTVSQWVASFSACTIALVFEVILNQAGLLTWEWSFWGGGGPLSLVPVFILGYLWFFYMGFLVKNMTSLKKQFITLGVMWLIVGILFAICQINGWII